MSFSHRRFVLALLMLGLSVTHTWAQDSSRQLAERLRPFLAAFDGKPAAVVAEIDLGAAADRQHIVVQFLRTDDQSMSLAATHPQYAMQFQRTAHQTRLVLPLHRTTIVSAGPVDGPDTLAPAGLLGRLVSQDSLASAYVSVLGALNARTSAALLSGLAGLSSQDGGTTWTSQKAPGLTVHFTDESSVELKLKDATARIRLLDPRELGPIASDPPAEFKVTMVDRHEMERLIARGIRRGLEVAWPAPSLTAPPRQTRRVPHGELRWVEDQRLVLLNGTPQQIGRAHGLLLSREMAKCRDSVLYLVGLAKTFESGRWFLNDLRDAYRRLERFIPDDHKAEMIAAAEAAGFTPEEIQLSNVFPELFHCSGFALMGSATAGGKLYHGRVLDYMTMIGLQDASAVFVIAPQGKNAFANVGYAGFIGSVSGMNQQQISLGEMGGRGEGNWDGVPMATLMRRALEECSTLDQVKQLWSESPRTCEYYYVFADGKIPDAVGVAATPQSIQYIKTGETHPLLGEGMKDAVVLSAGDRLQTLRKRVSDAYGRIDETQAMALMSRPVAMKSNLHDVLFVPQDLVMHVAQASHDAPACQQPFVRYDLRQMMEEARRIPDGQQALRDAAAKAIKTVPATRPADGFQAEGVEAVFFDALPWKGKPTRVFAWIGMPQHAASAKVPAMVLVHGGGGTAFDSWVRLWTSRGYAAIAIDTCGQVPRGPNRQWECDPQGGPAGWGGFTEIDAPPQDQWVYHAVTDVVLAHSLIRAWPGVDPDRTGITGISWGGYLTCITVGLDQRFKFGAPVYGCGFLGDDSGWRDVDLRNIGPEKAARWLKWWDPSEYLPDATLPLLWVDGTNDLAYPLNSVQKSYRLPKGPRTLATRVRMEHGHGGPGENPEEIRVFADSVLKGAAPLTRITSQGRDAHRIWAKFDSSSTIVKAELNYTTAIGKWQDRKWETMPADLEAGLVSAALPAGVTVYYLNLIDQRGLVVSSEHVEVPSPVGSVPTASVPAAP